MDIASNAPAYLACNVRAGTDSGIATKKKDVASNVPAMIIFLED